MKKICAFFVLTLNCFITFSQWNNDLNSNTPVADLNSADIVTASASDGKTWIAFYSQNGSNYDMRAQLLDIDGTKLLGENGVLVSNRKSGSATYVFNTCVDKDNNLIIAFQYQKTLSTLVCIACKINEAGVLQWGNGVELGVGLSPFPAALSNGDAAVAWINNSKINYIVVNGNGNISWSASKEISGGTKSVTRPQVVAFSGNNFGIVYQYVDAGFFGSHLYEQKYDSDGNPLWASASKISDYITSTFRYPFVQSDEDTTLIGYYANPSGQNRFDAIIQRVNPDGTLPWGIHGSDFSTDATNYNELSCFIAHHHGSPYLWATSNISDLGQIKYGISVQKFNVVTGERLLGNTGKELLPLSSNAYHDLGISLCNDKPLIMYTDVTNKIFASGLGSNGNPIWPGNNTMVASSSNTKYRYGFSKAINGQAVMVWQENKGIEDRPYAQNIRCDGTTGGCPVPADLSVPKISSTEALLAWKLPATPVSGITIRYAAKDAANSFKRETSGDKNKIVLRNLLPGTKYGWQIRSNCTSDSAAWISGPVFTTLSTSFVSTKESSKEENTGIQIRPNPSKGLITVSYYSNKSTGVQLNVFDINGKKVFANIIKAVAGYNKYQLNLLSLTDGIYILQLNNGIEQIQTKIIIDK